ncbi:C4-dicarboxylate TRAP transporter substrate-binding protein [Granulosicoccus antarcticus]|uniref:Solute-binding protein n=1 Tax=Granulosicoccus antarcticus IMCC3135 TaxID=1192854 RepID=A0A2Z2NXW0_9GAMM|nr:C4-dicarboxylate TRAP transporter substrate-binding protein [Granulosicoccus antarcticus]ASJ76113.1 hypothetical protein IMCC3135_30320 [Granulosicoccus antarcticus IMCC3135]
MKMHTIVGTVGVALSTCLMQPLMAAETIQAVVIDGYPAKAMWVQELSNFFIPEVDKRLAETGNYEMNWQESYGGTIVKPKGVLEGIELGLGDIGIVTTIFHSSKLTSQALAAVTPFITTDARVVAKAIDEIAVEFPTMQEEFAEQNQILLATGVVLDTYQLFGKEAISALADMEGDKIAGAGMNLRYLEGLSGTAGVRGGLTDFYSMLQTGLADQAMLWPEAASTFKIAEVAPFMLKADMGAVNSKTLTVNADYWEKLPEEVKVVLKEVAVAYRDHVANIAMDRAASSIEEFVAAGGTVVDMDPAQRKAWADAMPNIAVEWAEELDAKGKPGSDMLKAYMDKLEAAGFTPVRDWASEL